MSQFYNSAAEARKAQISNSKFNQGVLFVSVVEAKDICPIDRYGTADPYVVLQLNDTRFQTDINFNSTNPHFGESFTFNVNDLNKDILYICMVHDNAHLCGNGGANEEDEASSEEDNIGIGNIEINIKDLAERLTNSEHEFYTWVPLQDIESGSLHLGFKLVRKSLER